MAQVIPMFFVVRVQLSEPVAKEERREQGRLN